MVKQIDYTFPQGFLWGSSTSAPQSEGTIPGDGKGLNNWDYWYSIDPDKFHNHIGPEKAAEFYQNYQEDIKFLKQTGHTVFRTSIQWARLLPQGTGEVNQKAVEFYRDMFRRINAEGVKLMINLYHFDIPFALEEQGGWENKATVKAYEEYAKICFKEFGDLVDTWITFNEPIVPVECGYLYQYHYPCKVDPKAAVQVAYNTQLASALAVKACHEANPDHKISIVLNLTPAYPRSSHPADQKAARIAELFQAKSFLDPSVLGEYPKELVELVKKHDLTPDTTPEELAIMKENTVDFLGVNYYQPLRVAAPQYLANPESPFFPTVYYDHYQMPGRKMNPHRGWEIYERGIYDIAMNLKENYDNIEWILTENGMGVEGEEKFKVDGMIHDDYRIDFIKGHLKELHRAIADGANCQGYLLWTFIDCWSWLNAFKNRYGLVELDLKTAEKTIKKSGHWFKELSDNNGF
ncbi:6-phospho-beta-glucosidase [Granulicatella balaenopterae]|uniref:6-phospho-beta-glucosidase n=1 Tax=Granulicatella balaenopterae TaxID=137733 RepID=A0A1H9NG21_9LACT|nr:glycoside hydrolase family 1 protein [Granulicatella balaenopterae]SER34900.1 6-phospho-beta-glucosidase [Granulicatella balaenopterae]